MTRAQVRVQALTAAGLLALLMAAPAGAAPSPSPTPEPEDPIRVDVTQILPRSPGPGSAVEVSGTLRNIGSVPVTNLRVRLQVGGRIRTRSELQQADEDRPPTSSRVSTEPALTTLGPGRTATFTLHTSVRELGLDQLGVYPVDVVARGDAGDGMDSLGLTPTWLPFFESTPRPTRVAVVWPLVDVPHLRPDGTLLDDDLARLLAPAGRLGRLVAVARAAQVPFCEAPAVSRAGVPNPRPTRCEPVLVTFAVDPDLLDSVQTLAASTGAGRSVAVAWLEQLRAAGLGGRVLALPYADPDVSALSHDPRTKDDVANANALGAEVASQVLQTPAETAVAWPPPGPVTPAAADALALSGARSFVLDPSAYDDSGRLGSLTPTAHALFTTSATGAELNGLVVDPELSDLLTQSTPYGARVTEQRFLAETAIVAAEKPGVSRTLVLAPSRRTDVPLAALEELRDLGRVPWLCPVALGAVAAGEENCEGESGPPGEPEDRGDLRNDRSDELGAAYLRSVAADRDLATQLTDAVVAPSASVRTAVAALKGRLRRAVARAESSAGRDDPAVTRNAASLLHGEVQRLAGQVVVRGGRSLLTSTKGTLSVSVENTLSLPVQVRVRFTSKTATLTNAETGLVTIEPGHAVQATVHARAQRSGQFVVFAQLVDRDGSTFGPEAEIIVRSTRFGRLALALTLAAMGVLLVAAGVRIARRIRAARS
jgi:hypothetical protein